MFSRKNKIAINLILCTALLFSCQDLEELNINPNGVDPANAHPNLLLATVITQTAQTVVNLGYGDIAGVVQHTQKDGWGGSHNSYEWNDQPWNNYYGILRNAQEIYDKGAEAGLEFHQGVGLAMRAYVFGMIADLWGDAPYSSALKGEQGGEENLKPAFDSQRDIYLGILADLEQANALLSKKQGDYQDINATQDVLFGGDVRKWQRFANSIALRYYMRLSEKEPSIAKEGIERIAGDPATYPLILNPADDANVDFPGTNDADAWPANTVYDGSGGSNFRRLKMCATLVDALKALDDPRLAVWARPIDIPIVVDPSLPAGSDQVVDGKRYVAEDVAAQYQSTFGFPVNTADDYIGLPPAWSIAPQAFNLNPNLEQAPNNPHASHLNDRYKAASGPLLKGRLMSAAEVHFILAEAALKGWSVGAGAEDHYNMGVEASFTVWNVKGVYKSYIEGAAAFDGTLEQLIEQKWIASWTAAAEAWFDYRRTGLPALQPGPIVQRDALPIRFYYSLDEIDFNPANAQQAIERLEATEFSAGDGKNSAWSKMWLLQGTGKPW